MLGAWRALCCLVFLGFACSEPATSSFGDTASGVPDANAIPLPGAAAARDGGLGSAAGSASLIADAGASLDGAPGELASDAGFCTGQAVTVADLASGNVRSGATVLLPALVASSQKFLLSASKTSGKCSWAAFAVNEGKSGENSAVLLLSSVTGSTETDTGTGLVCPAGTDSLPDDLAPGDRLTAFGAFSDYAPNACQGTAPMRELVLKSGCAVTRMGHGEPPAPVALTLALADRLARGKDAALLRAWSARASSSAI
jgi:hypothetical protein